MSLDGECRKHGRYYGVCASCCQEQGAKLERGASLYLRDRLKAQEDRAEKAEARVKELEDMLVTPDERDRILNAFTERDQLKAKLAVAVEALTFYFECELDEYDGGLKARRALAKIAEETK